VQDKDAIASRKLRRSAVVE